MPIFSKESVAPSQIKKYTALVGSLFSGMVIVREGKGGREDLVKVPIQYGPSSLRNKQRDQAVKTGLTLPAMAFELSDISPDEARKIGQHTPFRAGHSEPGNPFKEYASLAPVPHNITYRLYIRAKAVEEGMQILEQIIGAFNPYVTVRIIDNEKLHIERDIPVRLEPGYDYTDNYEDSFEQERYVEIGLTITVSGYIYKRVDLKPVVLEMELNMGNTTIFQERADRETMGEYLKSGVSAAVQADMASVSKGVKNE